MSRNAAQQRTGQFSLPRWYSPVVTTLDCSGNKSPSHHNDFSSPLVASCFRGALPPVDWRAVCFVRAMIDERGRIENQRFATPLANESC